MRAASFASSEMEAILAARWTASLSMPSSREALSRFVSTKPKEVVDSIERSKTKKPPQDAAPRRPTRPKTRAPTRGEPD